jgi:pimeloyl-ACP methyl ester carboxylesterase
MFNNFTSKWLRWRRPTAPLAIPPDGIERFFVDTPGGEIEVLLAGPRPTTTDGGTLPLAALFFIHGGMGGAWVWLEYLASFAARGIP